MESNSKRISPNRPAPPRQPDFTYTKQVQEQKHYPAPISSEDELEDNDDLMMEEDAEEESSSGEHLNVH